MATKVMVISYNPIEGIPVGRYEQGNAVAYSAEWGFDKFAELSLMTVMSGKPLYDIAAMHLQKQAASKALANLENMLAHDLPFTKVVYVYIGVSARQSAMAFIKKLQELGKEVRMVACDCDQQVKENFAQQLGIDIIWTSCGGGAKCGEIFTQHAGA